MFLTSSQNNCLPGDNVKYGPITVGEEYHVRYYYNETTITAEIGLTANYPQSFPEWTNSTLRFNPTRPTFIGNTALVYFMSDKWNGIVFLVYPYLFVDLCDTLWFLCVGDYNLGNGTFTNITLTSRDLIPPATTAPPTSNPSDNPTHYPTSNPSLIPSFNPTLYPTSNPSLSPSLNPTSTPMTGPQLVSKLQRRAGIDRKR